DLASGAAVWSNEQFRLLGVQPGAQPADCDAWFERVHPDDRALVAGRKSAPADGATRRTEYRIVRADGAVRWLSDTWRVEAGEGGRWARLVGTSQDITERRLAEDARHESDERLREFAERTKQLYWTCTPDFGKVLYTSPSYRDLFGRDPALLRDDPL